MVIGGSCKSKNIFIFLKSLFIFEVYKYQNYYSGSKMLEKFH